MPNKILIVDDNTQNIQILASILTNNNYQVEYALSGAEAIEWLSDEIFDLILLDIIMPEMNGFEVCEQIKLNNDWKEIPIIFLTAKHDPESIKKGFELGGVDYITKPFYTEELLVRVNTQLQLKNSYDTIKIQSSELREHIIAQEKFFSIIAHDLKNPLSGLVLVAKQAAQRGQNLSDEVLKNFLDLILEASEESFELLKNLLHWSRVQSGIFSSDPELFEIEKITTSCFKLLQGNIAQKNIRLETNIDENVEVYGDIKMIKTVIRNLLSNAIKYSYNGGLIKINCSKKNNFVEFDVIDEGIGIKPEILKNIFNIERKDLQKGTEGEKGTGFGLLLCREFIEKNDGNIKITSTLGKGSKFSFTVPSKSLFNRD